MQKILDLFNTTWGRWALKAIITTFGGLVSSGQIPLDMPVIAGFSLGQILIGIGVLTPTGQMNPDLHQRLRIDPRPQPLFPPGTAAGRQATGADV